MCTQAVRHPTPPPHRPTRVAVDRRPPARAGSRPSTSPRPRRSSTTSAPATRGGPDEHPHHHAVRVRDDRRRGGRGHRPDRQAHHRHRRRVGHRHRDHPRAGRGRRRGHDRRAPDRPGRGAGRRRSTATSASARRSTWPTWRSVRAFVDAWDGPLDVLVNNAGVMAIQELTLNGAGLEMQFATNHVGHFALAVGLHDALAAADGGARIVSVSSRGHLALAGGVRRHRRSSGASTRRSAPTGSPRPPTCCSPSAPPTAGPATASSPTR